MKSGHPYYDRVAREARYLLIHTLIGKLAVEVKNAKKEGDKEQLLSKGKEYLAEMRKTERLARGLATDSFRIFTEEKKPVQRDELRAEIRDFNEVYFMVRNCTKTLAEKENGSLEDVRQVFLTLIRTADSKGWGMQRRPIAPLA